MKRRLIKIGFSLINIYVLRKYLDYINRLRGRRWGRRKELKENKERRKKR